MNGREAVFGIFLPWMGWTWFCNGIELDWLACGSRLDGLEDAFFFSVEFNGWLDGLFVGIFVDCGCAGTVIEGTIFVTLLRFAVESALIIDRVPSIGLIISAGNMTV